LKGHLQTPISVKPSSEEQTMPKPADPHASRPEPPPSAALNRTTGASQYHRVLQLTDPHLFADPRGRLLGMTTRRSFEAVLEVALARSLPAEALVLTGDLVHDESAEGYRALRAALEATRLQYYCIPGNHDSPALMRELLGSAALEEVAVRRLGGWNLLFLDSTQPGHVGGRLGPDRLAALANSLAADQAPMIVFLHHQPVPVQSPWIDRLGVVDGESLIRLCEGYPHVKAVVFGHVHQDFALQHRHLLILGSPSTCVQFMPGQDEFAIDALSPGYRELQLFADGSLRTTVVRLVDYSEKPGPAAAGY
jgi:3',5'-cyclic-AMP phosphodiesterase